MKMAKLISLIGALIAVAPAFANQPMQTSEEPVKTESIVLGGGCFWCLEPLFEMVKGVKDVEVAYAGGVPQGASYEDVCTGQTGHAESLKITFDPQVLSPENLLRIFFTIHDPTTLNAQGVDHGTQYRSVIFFSSPEEKERAQKVIAEIAAAKIWPHKIVTSVEPLRNYTRAEEYHQDYYKKYEKATDYQRAQMNVSYCHAIIEPKVLHFRQKFKNLLKGS